MFGGEGSKINSLEIGNAGIRRGRAGQGRADRREGKGTSKHEVLCNADA